MKINKFFTWSREFFTRLTVHESTFIIRIPLPQELRRVNNVVTVLTQNEIIILGNHKPAPAPQLKETMMLP